MTPKTLHGVDLDRLVRKVQSEIIVGMHGASPEIPPYVADFKDLHDHCDANLLGMDDGSGYRYLGVSLTLDQCCDVFNAMAERVDHWLQAGGHRRESGILYCNYCGTSGHEPENCPEHDDDDDPNDCPECSRSFGPHYRGKCNH